MLELIDGNVQKYEEESTNGRMETKYGIGKGFRWNKEGKDAMNPLRSLLSPTSNRNCLDPLQNARLERSNAGVANCCMPACLHATDADTGSEVTFGILQRYRHVLGVVDRFSAQRIIVQLKSRLLDCSQR